MAPAAKVVLLAAMILETAASRVKPLKKEVTGGQVGYGAYRQKSHRLRGHFDTPIGDSLASGTGIQPGGLVDLVDSEVAGGQVGYGAYREKRHRGHSDTPIGDSLASGTGIHNKLSTATGVDGDCTIVRKASQSPHVEETVTFHDLEASCCDSVKKEQDSPSPPRCVAGKNTTFEQSVYGFACAGDPCDLKVSPEHGVRSQSVYGLDTNCCDHFQQGLPPVETCPPKTWCMKTEASVGGGMQWMTMSPTWPTLVTLSEAKKHQPGGLVDLVDSEVAGGQVGYGAYREKRHRGHSDTPIGDS